MVARQGYSAGFNEGLADASRGKKFEPTDNKAYGKAIIPKGMNKDEFKQQYREAFVKGYTNGYKGEATRLDSEQESRKGRRCAGPFCCVGASSLLSLDRATKWRVVGPAG